VPQRRKPGKKTAEPTSGGPTVLDNFVTAEAEVPDDDIVMNEDGTIQVIERDVDGELGT
jgi:hypothetical protein